jgi:Flp pilus assembly protein TadD
MIAMDSKKNPHGRRKRDSQLVREELLRPSPYLGYDRDQLGVHFMGREAIELAESQFRRAAWLNPFEPAFKLHWAMALITLKRTVQAHQIVRDLLARQPSNREALALWHQYWPEQPLPRAERAERETGSSR